MLLITGKTDDTSLEMPSITPGETGSLTDQKDNTLVLFTCHEGDDGALISRSVFGVHCDEGDYRVVDSYEQRTLATLLAGEQFEMDIETFFGPLHVTFQHVRGQ